jgi:hypothetical protein
MVLDIDQKSLFLVDAFSGFDIEWIARLFLAPDTQHGNRACKQRERTHRHA